MDQTANQSPQSTKRNGLINPQVVARPGARLTDGPAKPIKTPAGLSIPEPKGQQVVSIIAVVGFVVLWLLLQIFAHSNN